MIDRKLMDRFCSGIEKIIQIPCLHARWLNTLSYWENCGARMLAGCEHPTKVKEEMLKHASEEFRHAYHLKQQIHRLSVPFLVDYRQDALLGGWEALHYLKRLEVSVCRMLREKGVSEECFVSSAYLIMTYAIEMRAIECYRFYHEMLKQIKSPVRIHSILLEEQEHLDEIEKELYDLPAAMALCPSARRIEASYFCRWMKSHMEQIEKDE